MSFLRVVRASVDHIAAYGEMVLVDGSGGPRTITLPPATIGQRTIGVKKTDASANAVTIARAGADLIEGAASLVLSTQNMMVELLAEPTTWLTTARVLTRPGAPTIGVATAGVLTASVPFTPPGDGGATVTGYTATSSPGGITGTGTASPITVNGLAAGTAYTFTVHATSALGTGPESAASNSVTPTGTPTAPGAPTIGAATAGDTTATANWTAPASDGGSAITGYQVKTYDSSGTLLATDTVGVVLTFTKTGLTNGTAVKFTVAAINAIGTGAQSAFSNTVTPAPSVSGTQWVTAWTPQTLRSDFTANLGCKFTVGGSPISVTALGRLAHSGNSLTHTVKIVRVSDEVEMASVVVATAGVAAGNYAETALGSPVTLAAGIAYYLVSSEVSGGDTWGDLNAGSGSLTTTAVAAANFAAYQDGTYTTTGVAAAAYGPVSFRYA